MTDWLMQCAYTLMDRYCEKKNIKQENKKTKKPQSRYLLNERDKQQH